MFSDEPSPNWGIERPFGGGWTNRAAGPARILRSAVRGECPGMKRSHRNVGRHETTERRGSKGPRLAIRRKPDAHGNATATPCDQDPGASTGCWIDRAYAIPRSSRADIE